MPIVLIGPPAAGKSTTGALLAGVLGREFVDADAACEPLYAEVGWSVERFRLLIAERGYERAHLAWEQALAHAVPRLVELHPHAVVALGAGHTHVTRPASAASVRDALAPAERVVLLRPSPSLGTSVRVLRDRCLETKGHDWIRDGVDWLHRWCADGRDEQLATETVHNADEPAEQTVQRLVEVWAADRGVEASGDDLSGHR